jgi:hypothetical protein
MGVKTKTKLRDYFIQNKSYNIDYQYIYYDLNSIIYENIKFNSSKDSIIK